MRARPSRIWRFLDDICAKAEETLKGDADNDVALSAEFHTRLANATHNEVIRLLAEPLHHPLESSLRPAKNRAPEMGHEGAKEHAQAPQVDRRARQQRRLAPVR